MTILVRFDETLRVRAELNQRAIADTGRALLAAIDTIEASVPGWRSALTPLRAYALAGIEGKVTRPHIWREEPLNHEFGEGLLPEPVLAAYGEFTFWTHGLTFDAPVVQHINGVAYVEVDD